MASPLEKFKILIADSDHQLATVSKTMLRGMGFSDIHLTTSGAKALSLINEGNFDFLITDWNLKDVDGIHLINQIRRDPNSPSPTIPVIMLTGRMEISDVQTARDNGIHEYVVKPFTAKTIYNRLERIVEFPRYFVAGKEFVGPDRRHKNASNFKSDRRNKQLLPQRRPWDSAKQINDEAGPKLWLPDFALKHKLGRNVTLESIITPAVLNQAQALVDAITDESLVWIKDDLASLKTLCQDLRNGNQLQAIVTEMNEVALMISSRSGTFGYKRASEVAYMLYLFLRQKFQPNNVGHLEVIEKHIEVLSIIFDKNIRGEDGDIVEIIRELKKLTDRRAFVAA